MNILIIGPSWVGDMVMAQTLFQCLQQRHPGCQIDVLAPDWSRPILERMPEVRAAILQHAADAIDPEIMNAVDVLFAAYSGDFDLGGTVRNVDLEGATGPGLSAQAGYLNQDGKLMRIMDITLPVIVSDLWTQVA